ncbi:MAG: TlpA disulfide reductase family protein [Candidatus Tumulicola sp.]
MTGWTALVLAALTASAGTGLAGVDYAAPPPDFPIPSANGAQHLYALRGRVVVIDFWATWCDVCTAEMKYFVRAQQSFGNRVTVLTVSPDSRDVAATYLHFSHIALPVIEDSVGAISRAYSVSKIPVTLVLNPSGNVSYVSVGALTWDELRGAIEQAAGGPSGGASLPAPSTPSPRVLQ